MKLPDHIEDEILKGPAETMTCKGGFLATREIRRDFTRRIARMVAEDCAWTARDMIEEGNEGGVVEILRERYGLKENDDAN